MTDNLRIVLVNTTHPGNIGAAARAMKTMGLSQLSLVVPQNFPNAEATIRASGADDILTQAQIYPSLSAAIENCTLVMGCSARLRSISWPQLMPREAAEQLVAESQQSPVALVFGQERSGLTNAELDQCHILVNIPTNENFQSLNVASAVQVLAYEIRLACLDAKPSKTRSKDEAWVSQLEMQHFYTYLEETMIKVGFLDPSNPKYLMRRLHRLFNRARLETMELNILRGMLNAIYNRNN